MLDLELDGAARAGLRGPEPRDHDRQEEEGGKARVTEATGV